MAAGGIGRQGGLKEFDRALAYLETEVKVHADEINAISHCQTRFWDDKGSELNVVICRLSGQWPVGVRALAYIEDRQASRQSTGGERESTIWGTVRDLGARGLSSQHAVYGGEDCNHVTLGSIPHPWIQSYVQTKSLVEP